MPINLDHTGAANVNLQSTAILLAIDKSINVTGDVTANTFIGNLTGVASSVGSSIIFVSTGAGDVAGTSYNGASARTISYNTIGSPSISGANATGTWGISISGSAPTLTTARSISASGDATWTVSFNGSANVSSALTLATVNSSPQTDAFRKITVNEKGLVTASTAVDATDITTALGFTPANNAGTTFTGTVGVPLLNIDTNAAIDSATLTTASVTPAVLTSFSTSTYGGGEFLIQATRAGTRQITKLLVLHDGVTAIATEYSTLITAGNLFTVEVDILSSSVRLLITPTSAVSTVFKTTFTLITV